MSEETDQIAKYLDSKYSPAAFQKAVDDIPQLDKEQQEKLLKLLQSYKKIFDSYLGQWKGSPYKVELQDGLLPIMCVPIPFLRHMNKRSKIR